jgi:hypothetical protein
MTYARSLSLLCAMAAVAAGLGIAPGAASANDGRLSVAEPDIEAVVISRNVANGLGNLRPEKRAYFLANAAAFTKALDGDINRCKGQVSGPAKLRVFNTQCGLQNFARLGGPHFIACKKTPGSLPKPDLSLEQVKQIRDQIIVIDPNTPSEYERAFREEHAFTVIEAPSSIERIAGAKSRSALFENLFQALLKCSEGLSKS